MYISHEGNMVKFFRFVSVDSSLTVLQSSLLITSEQYLCPKTKIKNYPSEVLGKFSMIYYIHNVSWLDYVLTKWSWVLDRCLSKGLASILSYNQK
jgi:hypothetical protein